ncbi:MAG: hypothetical protein KIT11_09190 [Fimbriimonadaceae bacterium]|nr:hypothetical protein [Fimbriimonadaceae bacterium]QYK55502.1 MAG: hypothetical protein KF733_10860 [Fimbriimonadaceae bacterium]
MKRLLPVRPLSAVLHALPSQNRVTLAMGATCLAAALLIVTSREAQSQVGGGFPAFVRLQTGTPGTADVGNANLSGRMIAGTFQGIGTDLTNLNAGNIGTGTVADARLSANVMLVNNVQTITAAKTFAVTPSFTSTAKPFNVSSATLVNNLNSDLFDGLNSTQFLNTANRLTVTLNLAGTSLLEAVQQSTSGSGIVARNVVRESTVTLAGPQGGVVSNVGTVAVAVFGQNGSFPPINPGTPAILGAGPSFGVVGVGGGGGVAGIADSAGYGGYFQSNGPNSVALRATNITPKDVDPATVELGSDDGAVYVESGTVTEKYNSAVSAAVPIAYGTVNTDGSRLSGTDNWAASYDGTRYVISITGETYFFANYTTNITAVNTSTFFTTTNSVGGNLLVYIRNSQGQALQRVFQFITYKTNPAVNVAAAPRHAFDDDLTWFEQRPGEGQAYLRLFDATRDRMPSKKNAPSFGKGRIVSTP